MWDDLSWRGGGRSSHPIGISVPVKGILGIRNWQPSSLCTTEGWVTGLCHVPLVGCHMRLPRGQRTFELEVSLMSGPPALPRACRQRSSDSVFREREAPDYSEAVVCAGEQRETADFCHLTSAPLTFRPRKPWFGSPAGCTRPSPKWHLLSLLPRAPF